MHTYLHVSAYTQTVNARKFRRKTSGTEAVYYNPLIFLRHKKQIKEINIIINTADHNFTITITIIMLKFHALIGL